jgi:hypothetical protein
MQSPTPQESREKIAPPKPATTNDSRAPQMKPESPAINTTLDSVKPRRAVLITIVYDDGSSQVIPVDPNSKINQLLGQ